MTAVIRPIPLARSVAPFYVGIDLGGTNTKIGLVDDLGRPIFRAESIPTSVEDGPEAAIERIAAAVLQMIDRSQLQPNEVARVGLGCAGILDLHAGVMVNPTNFPGWGGFPIRDALAERCGMPVVMANDASAAAFGELWIGSGRGFRSLVLLTLGTGVGCGVILGDLIIEGEHGHGTECGHILIDPAEDARLCSCGKTGHLEAYAGGYAVIQRTRERIEANPATSLKGRIDAGEDLTPLMVAEEAEKGDALAREIVMETARYLGLGIVTLLHTFDPSGVLIGGAMTFGGNSSPLGQAFLSRIREEVAARAFPVLAEKVKIRFAALGNDAGFIGAAGIARLEHRKER